MLAGCVVRKLSKMMKRSCISEAITLRWTKDSNKATKIINKKKKLSMLKLTGYHFVGWNRNNAQFSSDLFSEKKRWKVAIKARELASALGTEDVLTVRRRMAGAKPEKFKIYHVLRKRSDYFRYCFINNTWAVTTIIIGSGRGLSGE